MAICAMPRATLDIDIMIELGTLFRTKRSVEDIGFTLSSAPMEFHAGKIRIYRLCEVDALPGEELVLARQGHHRPREEAAFPSSSETGTSRRFGGGRRFVSIV